MESETRYILEMKHIVKKFGPIVALSNGYVSAERGKVTALVGGNGAGKSTLIKILSGAVPADDGEILFNGQPVTIRNVRDALRIGIKTIYQDLALIDPFTVTENLFVGREITYDGPFKFLKILNKKAMTNYAASEVKRMHLNIPSISARVRTMSGGQRQAIACARALMGNEPSVLVLDEPTAALGVREAGEIIEMIKKYRDDGAAIILISHNMRTVFDLADEIVVLRLGEAVCKVRRKDVTEEDIVGLITGAIEKLDADRDLLRV